MKNILFLFSYVIAVLFSMEAGATRILVTSGDAILLKDQVEKSLVKGSDISAPYEIRTAGDGYAQLELSNGTVISVSKGTRVSIVENDAIEVFEGGIDVLTTGAVSRILLGKQYVLKVSGFVRLRECDSGCSERKGFHGSVSQGEVIVEYRGGRSVVNEKPFLLSKRGGRPQLMAKTARVLSENNQLSAAASAKIKAGEKFESALNAFKDNRFDSAEKLLMEVKRIAPSESKASYYLGLTYLELGNKAKALEELQLYRKTDFMGAASRNVGQLITLLLDDTLEEETRLAIENEASSGTTEIEPNTVAVQSFSNAGNPKYAVLAKGIAAMIISDLSSVPGITVLEREKLQTLIDEIQLSESGLVAQDAAAKAGRIMKAEKVLFGSFGVTE